MRGVNDLDELMGRRTHPSRANVRTHDAGQLHDVRGTTPPTRRAGPSSPSLPTVNVLTMWVGVRPSRADDDAGRRTTTPPTRRWLAGQRSTHTSAPCPAPGGLRRDRREDAHRNLCKNLHDLADWAYA